MRTPLLGIRDPAIELVAEGAERSTGVIGEHGADGTVGLLLIIDDSAPRRAALLGAFAECRAVSVLGAQVRECAKIATTAGPTSLVADADEHGAIPEPVIELVRKDPRLRLIIPDRARLPLARQRFAPLAKQLHSVDIPVSRRELDVVALERKLSLGQIGPFTPLECLEAAAMGGYAVTVECGDASGVSAGTIAVASGAIVAARAEARTGLAALSAILTRQDLYAQLRGSVAEEPQQDLTGDWRLVIHEALRLHDEAARDAQVRPKRPPTDDGNSPGVYSAGTRLMSIPAHADAHGSNASVEELVDAGVRAILSNDYEQAIRALESALALRPGSHAIKHRLQRLYALRQREGRDGA